MYKRRKQNGPLGMTPIRKTAWTDHLERNDSSPQVRYAPAIIQFHGDNWWSGLLVRSAAHRPAPVRG